MKLKYNPGDMVLVPDGYHSGGQSREWRKAEVRQVRQSKYCALIPGATGSTLLLVRYLDDSTTTLVPHYAVRPTR